MKRECNPLRFALPNLIGYLQLCGQLGLVALRRSLFGVLLAGAAVSQAKACSLALVIAVDVSASISESEYDLQQQGIADALRNREVVDVIDAVGGIWLHSFEWSGRYQQNTLLGWRFLSDEKSIYAAAREISENTRDTREFMTALGHALAHASDVLASAPQKCKRSVIDVSADGINNEGYDPHVAYVSRGFHDVTVNALVIRKEDRTFSYYENKVIRGPGAFVQAMNSYEDYTEAMIRKLVREILGYGHAALQ
jgi:Ca-activated chloride channel homolog